MSPALCESLLTLDLMGSRPLLPCVSSALASQRSPALRSWLECSPGSAESSWARAFPLSPRGLVGGLLSSARKAAGPWRGWEMPNSLRQPGKVLL